MDEHTAPVLFYYHVQHIFEHFAVEPFDIVDGPDSWAENKLVLIDPGDRKVAPAALARRFQLARLLYNLGDSSENRHMVPT